MKVNVIGLGYIGLPTALMLASHDVKVIGTDYNEELVATLNAARPRSAKMGSTTCSRSPRKGHYVYNRL
ncbi:MAG: hypothetical protein ACLUW6_02080 [Coriobacteriaceae bacterium]